MLASFLMCSSMFFPTVSHYSHDNSRCHEGFSTEHIKHFQSLSLATVTPFISSLLQIFFIVISLLVLAGIAFGVYKTLQKYLIFAGRLNLDPPPFYIIEFLVNNSKPRSPPLLFCL